VDPTEPGLTRRRRGRGFSYHDESGAAITDPAEIARLKALVIPPAWQDVWISPDPQGHIQVLGTDAAGRRQYRYHDEWRRARDVIKYDRVLTLGAALADVRAEIVRRLEEQGLGRDRVLAGAVRMLDVGVFRAGGEQYAPSDDDEDGTFGLATLRRDHVSLKRGAGCDVRTADLNGAVKELAGEEYTCKDLRTWNATVLAAVALAAGAAESGVPRSARGRKRIVTGAVKVVSEHLGNTPTVARSSYVDPRVVERFEDGRTVLPVLQKLEGCEAGLPRDDGSRAVLERAVVELIAG